MKRPKKPTLAQLKKRPAWWIDSEGDMAISYPDGRVDIFDTFWLSWHPSIFLLKEKILTMTFGGWIENG